MAGKTRGRRWHQPRFNVRYATAFPNEPCEISRELYGRRKWRVLRSMPLPELIGDFGSMVPHARGTTKTQFLRALRCHSAYI